MVQKTRVNELRFGCIKRSVLTADLVNLGHLENTKGVRIFGLIGLSLLRQFELIIDYENSLLHFRRVLKKDSFNNPLLADTSAYSIVPVEIWNNKLVTRTTMAGKKLRLMIDSGAESNLLDSRLPDKIFDNVEILRRIQLTGAGAKKVEALYGNLNNCLLYTSPSPRDRTRSRMPSSA